MKRWRSGLCGLVLAAAMLLTACGGGNQTEKMSISPAELDNQAQNVADSFAGDTNLFRYTVNDSIETLSMTVWHYEDGAWENCGVGEMPITKVRSGGIGIAVSGKRFRTVFCDANWKQNASTLTELDFNSTKEMAACASEAEYSMSKEQEITANQEILLWAKIGGEESELNSTDFRKSKCEAGVAVTATFKAAQTDADEQGSV